MVTATVSVSHTDLHCGAIPFRMEKEHLREIKIFRGSMEKALNSNFSIGGGTVQKCLLFYPPDEQC